MADHESESAKVDEYFSTEKIGLEIAKADIRGLLH